MAFEFWRSLISGAVTAKGEILSIVWLQTGSSFFSRLGCLGEFACFFQFLLGAATAVLGAMGVLFCCGRNALCPDTATIDERSRLLGDERDAGVEEFPERNAEVTIRLEDRHLWPLRRHRCIVTVRSAFGGAQKSGQEVWLAKGAKSHR